VAPFNSIIEFLCEVLMCACMHADQYSADAIRVALADSSDTNDDGNFEEVTANAAILRLTKELTWITEFLAPSAALRTGSRNLADKVFSNAISCAAHAARTAYENMLFRDALKASMYELQNARDAYRVQLGGDGMHKEVVDEYLDVSVRTLTPICPHWCEHVWGSVLGKEGSVLVSGWPQVATPDFVLKTAAEFIEKLVGQLKSAIAKKEAPQKKKKDTAPPPKVSGLKLQVAEKFEGWRARGLAAAREAWDESAKKLKEGWMSEASAAAGQDESLAGLDAKGLKAATMPFLKMKGQEADEGGKQVWLLSCKACCVRV
jgi:leucyl-tRNA synthetase